MIQKYYSLISKQKLEVSVFVISLFHISGIPFLLYPPTRDLFISLTPFTLLLTFILLAWSHTDWNKQFLKFCTLAFSIGMLVEIIGVYTGWPFGNYSYGNPLGIKFANVPILIGINWLICTYSAGTFTEYFFEKSTNIYKTAIGALLMVILDYLVEPVAIFFKLWIWEGSGIPIKNYISWYLISFIILYFYYHLSFKKSNPLGAWVYLIFLLFFGFIGMAI